MGDRCYIHLACRRKDRELFEDIGFRLDFDQTPNSPLIEMVDEEANYAHWNEMPSNVPYQGHNGHGDNYSDGVFACDGKRHTEVEAGYAGGFVVAWDTKKNRPAPKSLKVIRRYLAVREKVQQMFVAMSQPATPQPTR